MNRHCSKCLTRQQDASPEEAGLDPKVLGALTAIIEKDELVKITSVLVARNGILELPTVLQRVR